LFVRAGSLLPLSSGALCAADAAVRELCVFCGADGAFTLYDDAGDGPADGSRISLRYTEDTGELTLEAGGTPVSLTVRFIAPDRSVRQAFVNYDGNKIRIRRGTCSPAAGFGSIIPEVTGHE
jgi:alpha-D-xyloside xylohydrolase